MFYFSNYYFLNEKQFVTGKKKLSNCFFFFYSYSYVLLLLFYLVFLKDFRLFSLESWASYYREFRFFSSYFLIVFSYLRVIALFIILIYLCITQSLKLKLVGLFFVLKYLLLIGTNFPSPHSPNCDDHRRQLHRKPHKQYFAKSQFFFLFFFFSFFYCVGFCVNVKVTATSWFCAPRTS